VDGVPPLPINLSLGQSCYGRRVATENRERRDSHQEIARMLLESYCSRLGSLVEHRYSSLALLEAKQQAEKAAVIAHEAMLQAKAADRAKSKFLTNMAHELRTPLNAIIGFSEIIKLDKIKARERYPEYAGYIYDAGSILLDIINSILDLARIETGKVQIEEEIIGFCTLVQSVITIIRPIAEKKSVEVDCVLDDPLMMVYVDPAKLKQILLNLLSNSVKFTDPRGRVRIDLVVHRSGDLVLSISDTGIGIPPEKIEKVFQPFEQVANHLTREHGGTGLGLPIAKALIELHGGELLLSSEVGVGTTARLRLPNARVRYITGPGTTQKSGDPLLVEPGRSRP
jgi:signal transduction histidine kinase